MRKDVKRLSEIYPPRDAAIGSDLDALGWAKPSDHAARYEILLSPMDFSDYSKDEPLRLLDVGCGLGLLLEYLAANSLLDRVDYTGVDLVDSMLKEARRRWPRHRFDQRDIRDEPYDKDEFDYCIVCGVFTVKHGNTYRETRAFAQDTLKAVWPSVKLDWPSIPCRSMLIGSATIYSIGLSTRSWLSAIAISAGTLPLGLTMGSRDACP
jgi:SAM-dependent methyltransferase